MVVLSNVRLANVEPALAGLWTSRPGWSLEIQKISQTTWDKPLYVERTSASTSEGVLIIRGAGKGTSRDDRCLCSNAEDAVDGRLDVTGIVRC